MNTTIVEEELHLTLIELAHSCRASSEQLIAWVEEGVLEPAGNDPSDWRFGGRSLQRARTAQRLTHDLQLNPPGVALALELLDRIDALEARLRRGGR
ncbi:MAG TPA: chaperone modulator CbpM [Albitalea sp.]|nr:chaperone modulator CbpM [Albitalea sp.]HJW11115.1 chaperone modulator CbpM [Albitalea sp.]